MKNIHYKFVIRSAAVIALSSLSLLASAQGYPNRPITIVVPYAAGGGTDNVARELAKLMSDKLGSPVIIDNRGGAGGAIGSKQVSKADADGYTLLFASSSFVTHAASYPKNSYDVNKDFAPIAMVGRGPMIVVAHKDVKAKTIPQLISAAKARPDEIVFSSSGPGTILHLAGELFKLRTGTQLTHVPYKGSGPAITDLLTGRTQVAFTTVPAVIQHVKAGKLELLAVTGSKRSAIFPNVPTVMEGGVPDYNITTWWGVLAPAGVPAPIISKLNALINEVSSQEPLKTRLVNEGAEPVNASPSEFKSVLNSELNTWKEVVKASNMSLN
ncbi:tripartite tricarboxylate transporter substrate binding protein [Noviherbaspirillum malthae]|uniref:tripartite tricarboxylate transporter substrate binding protein n=1 Tax=Noviherbaspirillum malthae TaxID=1260987 RepID=UPI00188E76AD|nr:tripartite tricarboxylate transporter substrate binding protein [Noviherbaspirillum malthae]